MSKIRCSTADLWAFRSTGRSEVRVKSDQLSFCAQRAPVRWRFQRRIRVFTRIQINLFSQIVYSKSFFWLEIIHENSFTGPFLSIPVTHVFHSICISDASSNRWNTFQILTDFYEFSTRYSGIIFYQKWKIIFVYI